MEKYVMFSDLNASTVMYPSGAMKTKDEVKKDYPILGTPYGVIGVTCEDDGAIGDVAFMFFYANSIQFFNQYKNDIDMTGMTNAQKCDAITAFVNQPKTDASE